MKKNEIILDLSSTYTENKVFLIDDSRFGRVVKKQYYKQSGFQREVCAFFSIPSSCRPELYHIDYEKNILYMEYTPIICQSRDFDVICSELMWELHTTTSKNGIVYDPGTGYRATDWAEYIHDKGWKWVESVKKYIDHKVIKDHFLALLEELKKMQSTRTSLIHRDIRRNNIGQKGNRYILLDYELIMWGDPYWDVARYLIQHPWSKETFRKKYTLDEKKVAIYLPLFAFCFVDYLVSANSIGEDFARCMDILENL